LGVLCVLFTALYAPSGAEKNDDDGKLKKLPAMQVFSYRSAFQVLNTQKYDTTYVIDAVVVAAKVWKINMFKLPY